MANVVISVAKVEMKCMEHMMIMDGMGNAGDTDYNSGVSMGDSVDNGESGVFNNTSVGLKTEGVPGVYFDNGSGSNGWFANINGDKGTLL